MAPSTAELTSASPRGRHAEDTLKNVGESRSEIGSEAVSAHPTVFEGSVAETVIGGALVAVLEDIVGLVYFLEAVFAILVTRIAIGVMLHGKLAKRRLELDLGGGASNTQDFVVVALGHPSSRPNLPRRNSRT